MVADEIRMLAEDSKTAVNEIQSVTGVVTDSVNNLTRSSNQLLDFVDEQVMDDYQNMLKGSKAYEDDATYLDQLITDFSAASQELLSTLTTVNKSIEEVSIATNEGAKGTTDIAQSSMDLTDQMSEMVEQGAAVREHIQVVDTLISKFTV